MGIRIRIEHGDAHAGEWAVSAPAGTTIGELITATGGPAGAGAEIDGRWCDASTPIDDTGCGEGSVVRVGERRRAPAAVASLAVVTGPDAGSRVALPPGSLVVGRGRGAGVSIDDPTVSRRHARVEVTAAGSVEAFDLGSRNGPHGARSTLGVGSLVRFGATTARLDEPPEARHDPASPSRHGSASTGRRAALPPRASRRCNRRPRQSNRRHRGWRRPPSPCRS